MGYLRVQAMPKIFDGNSLRIVIWPNDHGPQHVHIFSADGEAVIDIESVEIVSIYRMRSRDVHCAVRIVEKNRELFRKEWKRIHGT
jgi:hypothetical protein